MDPKADPLDDLLRPPAEPPAEPLRRRLLEETTAVLRRGRRIRWAALISSWAACFAVGAAAMLLWQNLGSRIEEKPPVTKNSTEPKPEIPNLNPEPPKEKPVSAEATALAKEWEAFDSTKNRAALFFEAGDRYLAESNDTASAIRCYRQALAAARPEELAIRPDDNWLVLFLKQSRLKEN